MKLALELLAVLLCVAGFFLSVTLVSYGVYRLAWLLFDSEFLALFVGFVSGFVGIVACCGALFYECGEKK